MGLRQYRVLGILNYTPTFLKSSLDRFHLNHLTKLWFPKVCHSIYADIFKGYSKSVWIAGIAHYGWPSLPLSWFWDSTHCWVSSHLNGLLHFHCYFFSFESPRTISVTFSILVISCSFRTYRINTRITPELGVLALSTDLLIVESLRYF